MTDRDRADIDTWRSKSAGIRHLDGMTRKLPRGRAGPGLLRGREEHGVAWNIQLLDDCAVVVMNTNKVNAQNDRFFTDLHDAFDRLERDFNPHPVVLTGQGDVFSAGIDFQYSFDIFGSGDLDKSKRHDCQASNR